MLFSKPCEYAIRALTSLVNAGDAAVGAREIALAEDIPLPVLGKILQGLVRKGLLDSRRGPGGGFRLARRPELILLRDIVAAVDGLDHFMNCVLGLPQCSEETPCPLHNSWKDLRARIFEDMDSTTLAQMAQAAASKKAAHIHAGPRK
jgi:Rrf2 family protein